MRFEAHNALEARLREDGWERDIYRNVYIRSEDGAMLDSWRIIESGERYAHRLPTNRRRKRERCKARRRERKRAEYQRQGR